MRHCAWCALNFDTNLHMHRIYSVRFGTPRCTLHTDAVCTELQFLPVRIPVDVGLLGSQVGSVFEVWTWSLKLISYCSTY